METSPNNFEPQKEAGPDTPIEERVKAVRSRDNERKSEEAAKERLAEVRRDLGLMKQENTQGAESLEEIKGRLEDLNKEHYLACHQTWNDSAEAINKGEYFGDAGLTGTAILMEADKIAEVLPELDKPTTERDVATHKGANSMVIMTIPKSDLDKVIGRGLKGIDAVDDLLIDKFKEGEIKQFGLPNKFVYGYYHSKTMHKNPKFNPKFE